jgi:hypothetical protein
MSDDETDENVTGDLLDLVESTDETSEPDEVVDLISTDDEVAAPQTNETVEIGEDSLEGVDESELEAEEQQAPTFVVSRGPEPQPLFTALLVASAVLLTYSGILLMNVATGTSNVLTNNPVTAQLANLIVSIFGK